MDSKGTYERFNSLVSNNKIVCTDAELNEFEMYGLLIKVGDEYITRTKNRVDVEVIKTKTNNLDIKLDGILAKANEISKESNEKRLYFMTKRCYNNYIEQGLIITQGDKSYYRLFEKERWLVCLID